MTLLFVVNDRTGRAIRLTKAQWDHISTGHPDVPFEELVPTLSFPDRIVASVNSQFVCHYYRYYKTKAKYLSVVVKYLNGHGFVITAYYVRRIQ
jgi:hypothetical protein